MSNRHHGQPWCAECRQEDYENFYAEIELSRDRRRHDAIDRMKPATDLEWLAYLDNQQPVEGREFVRYQRLRIVPYSGQILEAIANGAYTDERRDNERIWAEG